MSIFDSRPRRRRVRRTGTNSGRAGAPKTRIGPHKRKLLFAMLIAGIAFLLIIGKLFDASIIHGKYWTDRAMSQWTRVTSLKAERGRILDRNGTTLASSYTTYQICLNPQNIQDSDRERIASILSMYLGMNYDTVYAKMTKTRPKDPKNPNNHERVLYSQIKLKDQVDKEVISKLNSMQLGSGVSYYSDVKRDYPEAGYYAQLIGFTNIDGDGQTGVELTYNKYLAGEDGYQKADTDRDNNPVPGGEEEYVESVPGADVVLTVDTGYQGILENALQEACSINNAKSAAGILMVPKTGEILAIGTYPTFESSNPPRSDAKTLLELSKNRIVTDTYEPGSTFKVVTLASALESGAVTTESRFRCSGSLLVRGEKIKCWKSGGHGEESLAEAVQNSCNPAFMSMALKMGVDTFYDYIFKFGFDEKTDSGVMGETSGTVTHKKYIRDADLARIGFGQSVAVTPIQLLRAVCAAINGGQLLRPYVVKEIADASGNVIQRGEKQVLGQPISAETSATMRKLLEDVVTLGGGKNAYIPGYHVGGKTGTAQVYVDGVVSRDTHIGSFVGFAPADDPRIAVILIVDEANVAVDFGSVTAAPYAREILERSLVYMGVAPETNEPPAEQATVPDVTGMEVDAAIHALEDAGFDSVLDGAGRRVKGQLPAAGATMNAGALVMLYVEGRDAATADAPVTVPDVTGMPVTEANRLLMSYGLELEIEGSGLARNQSPAAGEQVNPTTRVTVRFEPP